MVLWNFDLLKKKLWYYGKNYGTIPITMEPRFTTTKNMVETKKLRFIMGNPVVIYLNN